MINVVTWNMQGGGGENTAKNAIFGEFFNDGYDVICLQEMTNPLNSFSHQVTGHNNVVIASPPPTTRRDHAPSNYVCYYKQWGVNSRCSLAIYTRGHALNHGVIDLPSDLGGTNQ